MSHTSVYRPTQIKNDFSHQLERATDEEISAFKRQAAIDWECFLLQRAKELKAGIDTRFCTTLLVLIQIQDTCVM